MSDVFSQIWRNVRWRCTQRNRWRRDARWRQVHYGEDDYCKHNSVKINGWKRYNFGVPAHKKKEEAK